MIRLVVLAFIFIADHIQAQVKPVMFEQIEALQIEEEKLVMVLIETDWCKYCQAMKYAIKNDKKLSILLEKGFHTIFMNSENKNDIEFAGQKYSFKPTGVNTGIHELAEQLGSVNGQLSFPTLCFLNKQNEIVYQHAGFLDTAALVKLLNILLSRK